MIQYNFAKTQSTSSRILAAIKHFNTVSIKSISKSCDLSVPMVTRYVDAMLQEGLLTGENTTVAAVGRKPKLFSLNANYGYIIGVELGLLHVAKIGVFAFDGGLAASTTVKYIPSWSPDEIMDNILIAIERLINANLFNKILYIVLGNPGVVDPESGTMTLAAQFASWSTLPLRQIFMNKFNVPVEVINDVNLAAIGEKEYGVGVGYSNFVFIRLSLGLKAGIILRNRLYQGESYAAGEIGGCMISTTENGNVVYKKAEQCLCLPAIYEKIAAKLGDDPNDIFYTITGGDPNNVTADNIAKALSTDSYVGNHIAESGKLLGYMLANVVSTLDIDLIILGGDVTKFNNYFIKPVRDILSECLISQPAVLKSSLGDDVALYGAFAVGLEGALTNMT